MDAAVRVGHMADCQSAINRLGLYLPVHPLT